MLEIIDLHTGALLPGCNSSVLCLGNFDGVHIGHAELIAQTLELKKTISKKINDKTVLGGAWCFRQPPAEILLGEDRVCLTTTEEKLKLFAELGLDIAVLGDFSLLKDMSPSEFTKDVLKNKLNCNASVCGFNFRFGKGASGTPKTLFDILGNDCRVVEPISANGETVSSSLIRKYISEGDAEIAARLLGRPYFLTGVVEQGKKLGGKLGFPTANQFFPKNKLIPRKGVYVTSSEVFGKEYISVSNVGTNPTVGDAGVRCETHIIGFDGELYGEQIKVSFHKFLRGEQKFNSIYELTDAVQGNIIDAREFFNK